MSDSKFSKKTSELKRNLVASGLALAALVSSASILADTPAPAKDVVGDKLKSANPNEGEQKTKDILAGVQRGGLGYAYLDDNAWDPLNPYAPAAAPINVGGGSASDGGQGGGSEGGLINEGYGPGYYGAGYYGGVYYGGGYFGGFHGGVHGGGYHGGGGFGAGG